jgi:hypothetical protein
VIGIEDGEFAHGGGVFSMFASVVVGVVGAKRGGKKEGEKGKKKGILQIT